MTFGNCKIDEIQSMTCKTVLYMTEPQQTILYNNTMYIIRMLLVNEVNKQSLWELCRVSFIDVIDSCTKQKIHKIVCFNPDSTLELLTLDYADFAEIDEYINDLKNAWSI